MKKKILFAVIGAVILAVTLGGIEALQINQMIAQQRQVMPETVTTAVAHTEAWESLLTSVASLVAVQGVMVSAEVAGKVVHIDFEPGTMVNAGDLLVGPHQRDSGKKSAQFIDRE